MRSHQQLFLDDITGHEPLGGAGSNALYRPPPAGTVEDRRHVYAHGYRVRIVDALRDQHVAVARILGAAAFEALVHRYLDHFPPRSFDLGHAGDRLPAYIEKDRLGRELPFLRDLATLEQRVADAFTAADAEPLTWSELRLRDPLDIVDLPLLTCPGATLVRSQWPIHELWATRDVADDRVSVELEGRPATVLVHRVGFSVRVTALDAAHAALIEAALTGPTSLACCIESGTGLDVGGDVTRLIAVFRDVVDLEVLVSKNTNRGFRLAVAPHEEES